MQQPAAITQSTDKQTDIILQQTAAKLDTTSITNLGLAQIPWSDHQVLLDKVKDYELRKTLPKKLAKQMPTIEELEEQMKTIKDK